jgi:hypothetical protein
MLIEVLNDWRRLLLLKEERFSLRNLCSFSKGFKGAPGLRKAWSSFFYKGR